jgi:predicted P-loop ATPase
MSKNRDIKALNDLNEVYNSPAKKEEKKEKKQERQVLTVDVAEVELSRLNTEVRFNDLTRRIDVIDHGNTLNGSINPDIAVVDYIVTNYKERYKYCTPDYVNGVIRLLADRHRYNPIIEKMKPYKKYADDGNDYIKELGTDILYLNESDTLSFTYLRKFMMQVMAMIENDPRNPWGADGMLVIVCPDQGIGKSLFAQRMALGFHSEINFSAYMDETDLYSKINGALINEFSELEHSLRPKYVELMKRIIVSPHDTYRVKFGRQMNTYPRKSCFIGTCNTQNFLYDLTGNRRFWCIKAEKPFNIERLSNYDDDIFLKAYAQAKKELELNGMQSFRLTEQERELTNKRNLFFTAKSPDLSNLILSLLEYVDTSHFTIDDLKNQSGDLASVQSSIIGRELNRLPNITQKRTSKGRFYCVEVV